MQPLTPMCSVQNHTRELISAPETLLPGTFRLPLKKTNPKSHYSTVTTTALEKLKTLEKHTGCTFLTEGIADNR